MSDPPQGRPGGTPRVPARLEEGMRAATANPASHPGAYIQFTAAGGVRGEEYEFEYRVEASGKTMTRVRDELRGRDRVIRPEIVARADPERFRSIASSIDIAALMQADHSRGGFPPDSVVGRLELSDGEQTESFMCLVDEGQAERARMLVPDPIRDAVDAIYAAAATALGHNNNKP